MPVHPQDGPRGGSLRRPIDRLESALGCALLVAASLLALVSAWAGVTGYRDQAARLPHPPVAVAPAPATSTGSATIEPAGIEPGAGLFPAAAPVVSSSPGSARAILGGVSVAVTLFVAGAVLLGGAWWVASRAILRRNLRRWEREWARIGPYWRRDLGSTH